MSEEEIYKMLLTENIEKFPLLNEIFAIRNNKFKINDYTIYVTGCISLDVINRAIEKANLIDKLQKREIKLNELLSDREIEVAGRDIKIDKLQKENAELKEEILNFIPCSMHEVEFKTKLIKILGETKDEE